MLDIIPSAWIPAVIFFARICDVSLGTLRIQFVARSMSFRAALLGFIEVLIWILVVAQLFQHLNNWANFVAYAGGFAVGTYLGIAIEKKLKVGTVIIRAITSGNAGELIERLQSSGYMLTRVEAQGGRGPVEIIFTVVKRKHWKKVIEIIESYDPNAFYSIEDVKYSSTDEEGMVSLVPRSAFDRLLRIRKGL